ncbi:hypothetical protein N8766_02805 [bacterium]|nr:hypothetical protein [bacterium]
MACLVVIGLGFGESQTQAEFRTYSMTASVPDVGKLRTILGDRVTITFELDPEVRWDSKKAEKDQMVENLGSRWYFGRSGKGRGMWPCRIRGSSGFYIDQDSPELVAYSGYGMDGHDFCRMNNNFLDNPFEASSNQYKEHSSHDIHAHLLRNPTFNPSCRPDFPHRLPPKPSRRGRGI